MKSLRLYLLAYPLLLPLAFYATWLAGRFYLGHWPRPSLDDPGYIGAGVDALSLMTIGLLLIGLPAFLVASVAFLVGSWRDKSQRSRARLVSACSMACMLASMIFLSWDPLRVGRWFFD